MRLIDKDALMTVLGITDEECSKCDLGDGTGYCTFSSEWTTACDAICTAPVIEERKTGKWMNVSDGFIDFYECSQCGKHVDDFSNYCPNCGADMREQP